MKVLLATDGTNHGDAAVDMLDKLRIDDGDEVKVICVVDMAVPLAIDVYGGYLPDTSEIEKAARDNAAKIIETTTAKVKGGLGGGVKVESDVLFGSPDSRIVETAEEMGADLIVLGSHGYKLGTVAPRVCFKFRRSSRPLFGARGPGARG